MEQETSNNLIESFEGAQEKIEMLEEKCERNLSKIESRDLLIKELETVIAELTEQMRLDQN